MGRRGCKRGLWEEGDVKDQEMKGVMEKEKKGRRAYLK